MKKVNQLGGGGLIIFLSSIKINVAIKFPIKTFFFFFLLKISLLLKGLIMNFQNEISCICIFKF